MRVSELIQILQGLQEENGDLEVQGLVPEGPYTRLEGPPEFVGLGYSDGEGEFRSEDDVEELVAEAMEEDEDLTEEEVRGCYSGPYICIGAMGID